MSIRFISVIDESGVELVSFPKGGKTDFLGGVIAAINEAIERLEGREIEKISFGDRLAYIERIDGRFFLVVFTVADSDRSRNDLSIKWFISSLGKVLGEKLNLVSTIFEEDYERILVPSIKEALEIYNKVEEILVEATKLYRIGKRLLGIKVFDYFSACSREGVKFVIDNDEVFIESIDIPLNNIEKSLMSCLEMFKKELRNLM